MCGGKGNISSVTHCATRLRLFIISKETVDTAQIKKIKGVLGTVYSGDELQIVLGKNLIPVYQEAVQASWGKDPGGSRNTGGIKGSRSGRRKACRERCRSQRDQSAGRETGGLHFRSRDTYDSGTGGRRNVTLSGQGAHAPSTVFWRLAALTSIGVRPVRLIPLPCQPLKYGTWGPKEFCASDL